MKPVTSTLRRGPAVPACAAGAAAFWLLTGALATAQGDPQALQRMVASERAFAAATAEIGVRDGFLAFFAEDAVAVESGPSAAATRIVSARAALRARPLPQLPLAAKLLWNPHTGQMSSDGTFGWLTGPYVAMNQAGTEVGAQGAYFSVWKRQADGTWRVWLDEGITLPAIWQGASEFVAAPAPSGGQGGTAGETVASAEADVTPGGAPWQTRWSDAVRVHRQGHMPVTGRAAAVDWAARTWTDVSFHVTRIETAASGDLAIAIGGYDARGDGGAEHGTWVRVWARDIGGRWRIVFETSKPAA